MKTILFILIICYCHEATVFAFSRLSIENQIDNRWGWGKPEDPNLPIKCYGGDLSESLKSGVNDMVIVKQNDGTLKSTPLQARIGKLSNWRTMFKSRKGRKAKIYVNNVRVLPDAKIILSSTGAVYINEKSRSPTCSFTSNELKQITLNEGLNEALLVVDDLKIELPFSIYLLNQGNRLVITDVDGTITTSDFKGFIGGNMGIDVHHANVVEFLDKVSKNGYTVIYLSARPVSIDEFTRDYLFDNLQNTDGGYSLPMSPLFMSPITVKAAISADPSIMKIATLHSLLDLFDLKQDDVFGAYGNTNPDTESYLNVGINDQRIFSINKKSEMINVATGTETSYLLHARNINTLYPKF